MTVAMANAVKTASVTNTLARSFIAAPLLSATGWLSKITCLSPFSFAPFNFLKLAFFVTQLVFDSFLQHPPSMKNIIYYMLSEQWK